MGLLLHIRILEYLQHNHADGAPADIKPAFEKYLTTMPKRKEFKGQLDYLLDKDLAASTSRFDYLNWELLTGLYSLDNKKMELAITPKGKAYLEAQTTPKFETAENNAVADPQPVASVNAFEPPATVLKYPMPGQNQPVTIPPVIAAPAKPLSADGQQMPQPQPVAAFASQNIETPQPEKKHAPVPLAPQPKALRDKLNGKTPDAAAEDAEQVIVTARNIRVFNNSTPAQSAGTTPTPERARVLKSISELPPGPVSLGNTPGMQKAAFKARGDSGSPTSSDNPFAGLEVIPLAPDEGKPKKKISTATLLRWAVLVVALVLAVLLYLIFKKRY